VGLVVQFAPVENLERGNTMQIDNNNWRVLIDAISAARETYDHLGLHVTDDDDDLAVGVTDRRSLVWENNEPTDQQLPGLFAVNLASVEQSHAGLAAAIKPYMWDGHRRIALIGSHYADGGYDIGGIVMRDGEVLAIIQL